ncbi:MAG: amino acid ABC transporter permease [Spirochaetia bacterium]
MNEPINKVETIGGEISLPRKRLFRLRSVYRDILMFLLLWAVLIWLLLLGASHSGYKWHWYRVPRYILSVADGQLTAGPLLQGLGLTLEISAISLVLAFAIGLVTALLRLSESFIGRAVARAYLEAIRNTPMLVQLFVIYFILGPILGIERFPSAVLALSLFEGAYASEVFRAGIVSIDRGQWLACHSLGLSTADTYRFVILPQAIRRILPPLTSQAVSLVKDSSLVSMVSLTDLTLQAGIAVADTFMPFEIWFTTAAMYLVITATLSTVVSRMEQRMKIAG